MTDIATRQHDLAIEALSLLRAKITRLQAHSIFNPNQHAQGILDHLDEPWTSASAYDVSDVDAALNSLNAFTASFRANLDDRSQNTSRSHSDSSRTNATHRDMRHGGRMIRPITMDTVGGQVRRQDSAAIPSPAVSYTYSPVFDMPDDSLSRSLELQLQRMDQALSGQRFNPFDYNIAPQIYPNQSTSTAEPPQANPVLQQNSPSVQNNARLQRDIIQRQISRNRPASFKLRYKEARLGARAQMRQINTHSLVQTLPSAECAACNEAAIVNMMYRGQCAHYYCQTCAAQLVQSAMANRSLARCCGMNINATEMYLLGFIPKALFDTYMHLDNELQTPNPVYCANNRCSTFIPPTYIHGQVALCWSCSFSTCTLCRGPSHTGICKADENGLKLKKLAEEKGWKSCPNCQAVIERNTGCLHMTCRCGHDFCYHCTKPYRVCRSTCQRT